MTSVNKFGNYLGSEGKLGPPGVGFMLTVEGNYDMQNRILTNLKDPVKDQDAVTVKLLKRRLGYALQWEGKKSAYACQNNRITELRAPEKDADAVNLAYLKEKTLNCSSGESFDAKNKRLRGLSKPKEPSDAVNMEFLAETVKEINDSTVCLKKDVFDAKGKVIGNAGHGEGKNDVVTLALLKPLLKIHAYYTQRDLADAVIHLRREIHDLQQEKYTKKDIENHLKSIEDSYKKTWRAVVQSRKAAKIDYTLEEKKQITDLIKVSDKHLNFFLENE